MGKEQSGKEEFGLNCFGSWPGLFSAHELKARRTLNSSFFFLSFFLPSLLQAELPREA